MKLSQIPRPKTLLPWLWVTIAVVATSLLIASTRYELGDCWTANERFAPAGCYVLDRWTGRVEFKGR